MLAGKSAEVASRTSSASAGCGADCVVDTDGFASGTAMSAVAAAVNTLSETTGVTASLVDAGDQTSGLVFNSTDYGSDSFVSVRQIGSNAADFNVLDAQGGTATQRDNGVDSVDGHLELASRDKYAALHNLPLPGSGRVTSDASADQKNTCVDVCAEFTGIRDCQTRCARDKRDKKHACGEACQTAFGSACDRAFPASGEGGSTNFKICLSYMSASCEDTCGKFRS